MPKAHKQLLAIVAVLVFLQFYFVRELIAAEFLFGAGFAVFLALAGILYVIGAIGERSLEWLEAGVNLITRSTHRIYSGVSFPVPAAGYRTKPPQPEMSQIPDADF